MLNKLSEMQMDALKEIGNIGAGNAATSMSEIMKQKIDMSAPNLQIIPFEEVMEMLGDAEETVVANMFRIEGNAPGSVYLIMTVEEANEIAKQFSGIPLWTDENIPAEIAVSAIQEFSNILTGAYISALADFTGLHMQPTIPLMSIDMAGAVISQGLIEISQESDYAIIIDSAMIAKGRAFRHYSNGQFLLLPDPESFAKIFAALGISNDE